MVEVIASQNQHLILKRNGRLMASFLDPLKEAEGFIQPYMEFCKQKPLIVVFGAGSGYHLKILKTLFPEKEIILFEVDSDITQALFQIHPRLVVSILSSVSESLLTKLRQGAVLIRHRPSWIGREQEFESAWLACKGPQILHQTAKIHNGPKPFSFEDRLWLCLRELFK